MSSDPARLLKLLLRVTFEIGNGGGGMNTELKTGCPSESGEPFNSEVLLRCVGLKGSTEGDKWDFVGLLDLLTELRIEL